MTWLLPTRAHAQENSEDTCGEEGSRRSRSRSVGVLCVTLGIFFHWNPFRYPFFVFVNILTFFPAVVPSPLYPSKLLFFARSIPEEISNPCSQWSPRDHQNKRLFLGGGSEDQGESVWRGWQTSERGWWVHIFGFVQHVVSVATTKAPQDIVGWLLL